jgi:4-oxalocrotonate tautomerase
MPFVNIRIAGPTLAPEQIRRLQLRTTEIMVTELGRTPQVTSVLVEQPAISGWAVGGRPALVAAHVDAEITAGTATPAQKAAFIHATNTLLKQVLGADLAVVTYVTVVEIPGDAWGYDGRTQTERLGTDGASAPV